MMVMMLRIIMRMVIMRFMMVAVIVMIRRMARMIINCGELCLLES